LKGSYSGSLSLLSISNMSAISDDQRAASTLMSSFDLWRRSIVVLKERRN
jgi:hypothetical protein